MTFRLAHISDVHLGPLPEVRKRELIGKRITGYINWRRNRAKSMGNQATANLLAALARQAPDHLAITGDLINIGLDVEVEIAGQWLRDNFNPHDTSVVPGNHDAYIRGTLAKAISNWSPFMEGDNGARIVENSDFPFVRVRENIALIGVSSAVATPAFVAAGRFDKRQAAKLTKILEQTKKAGLFRVIMIHHPPVRGATLPRKRLYGIGRFQDVIAQHGAELVLHGHTHLPQRHQIDGPEKSKVPVIGVPAAGQGLGGKKPPSAYNLFEISGEPKNWSCQLSQHSLTATTGTFNVTERITLFS